MEEEEGEDDSEESEDESEDYSMQKCANACKHCNRPKIPTGAWLTPNTSPMRARQRNRTKATAPQWASAAQNIATIMGPGDVTV